MDKFSLIYSNKQLTVAAVNIHRTGDEQLYICILLGGKVGCFNRDNSCKLYSYCGLADDTSH